MDDTQKIPRKYPERLSANQIDILKLLEGDGRLTRNQIADRLNLSPETIKKNVSKLKKRKLIRRIGPDKGGHWEVTG